MSRPIAAKAPLRPAHRAARSASSRASRTLSAPLSSHTFWTAADCASNNGSKSTPCLSADLFGDWREEVVWRTADNKELRIYTTTIPTAERFYTFMHDPQYRLSIAWQNVGYNQPPHTSFFVGEGMKRPPRPNIVEVRAKKR